jgi:hypothetical protein
MESHDIQPRSKSRSECLAGFLAKFLVPIFVAFLYPILFIAVFIWSVFIGNNGEQDLPTWATIVCEVVFFPGTYIDEYCGDYFQHDNRLAILAILSGSLFWSLVVAAVQAIFRKRRNIS